MMKTIGSFESKRWGRVRVVTSTYLDEDGPLAVAIVDDCDPDDLCGAPISVLSVNMYKPHCSADSRDLPKGCFYVKTWSENEKIAAEALASGLFIERPDLPIASSGWVQAPAWQIKEVDHG